MCSSPSASNNHVQTAPGRAAPILNHVEGHAVGRYNFGLIFDPEFFQRRHGLSHHGPVGVRPHHDSDAKGRGTYRNFRGWGGGVVHNQSSSLIWAAVKTAREHTASKSSPSAVTWPTLRPGRTSLP